MANGMLFEPYFEHSSTRTNLAFLRCESKKKYRLCGLSKHFDARLVKVVTPIPFFLFDFYLF